MVDQLNPSGASPEDINSGIVNARNPNPPVAPKKEYKSIKEYKPNGHLVYSQDMFEKVEKKVSFA